MIVFFFLMIRRPPRSTLDRSSAASDVYKRQHRGITVGLEVEQVDDCLDPVAVLDLGAQVGWREPVSYTHLRAHEPVLDLVCRLLLETQTTTEVPSLYH